MIPSDRSINRAKHTITRGHHSSYLLAHLSHSIFKASSYLNFLRPTPSKELIVALRWTHSTVHKAIHRVYGPLASVFRFLWSGWSGLVWPIPTTFFPSPPTATKQRRRSIVLIAADSAVSPQEIIGSLEEKSVPSNIIECSALDHDHLEILAPAAEADLYTLLATSVETERKPALRIQDLPLDILCMIFAWLSTSTSNPKPLLSLHQVCSSFHKALGSPEADVVVWRTYCRTHIDIDPSLPTQILDGETYYSIARVFWGWEQFSSLYPAASSATRSVLVPTCQKMPMFALSADDEAEKAVGDKRATSGQNNVLAVLGSGVKWSKEHQCIVCLNGCPTALSVLKLQKAIKSSVANTSSNTLSDAKEGEAEATETTICFPPVTSSPSLSSISDSDTLTVSDASSECSFKCSSPKQRKSLRGLERIDKGKVSSIRVVDLSKHLASIFNSTRSLFLPLNTWCPYESGEEERYTLLNTETLLQIPPNRMLDFNHLDHFPHLNLRNIGAETYGSLCGDHFLLLRNPISVAPLIDGRTFNHRPQRTHSSKVDGPSLEMYKVGRDPASESNVLERVWTVHSDTPNFDWANICLSDHLFVHSIHSTASHFSSNTSQQQRQFMTSHNIQHIQGNDDVTQLCLRRNSDGSVFMPAYNIDVNTRGLVIRKIALTRHHLVVACLGGFSNPEQAPVSCRAAQSRFGALGGRPPTSSSRPHLRNASTESQERVRPVVLLVYNLSSVTLAGEVVLADMLVVGEGGGDCIGIECSDDGRYLWIWTDDAAVRKGVNLDGSVAPTLACFDLYLGDVKVYTRQLQGTLSTRGSKKGFWLIVGGEDGRLGACSWVLSPIK
ncbi:hypothetical protein HDV05_000165 [Chytridiales sp. JEL 0842]|nr:hypothetical protein HDV05_000165 [Chytridiales sp. JEL 0842]